ncbi:MAG: N-acetylmuramidase family protein [Blastomonas sp.]
MTHANQIATALRAIAPGKALMADDVPLINKLAENWDARSRPAPAAVAKIGLGPEDYAAAAKRLGCTVAQIRAVDDVESAGSGFLPDGRPKILFEAHWFDKFTGGKFRTSHSNLSSAKWNRSLYVGGAGEWDRLNRAIALDSVAALKSASAGRYQIMGFNHAAAGHATVEGFWNAMKRSERDHLDAFVSFIESKKLQDAVRQISNRHADNIPFAKGYNGAGYAANEYHVKIARAHSKHS